MNQQQADALRQSYDAVAAEYAQRISHELEHKPLDRELLRRFAGRVPSGGLIADLGCGPGHVAQYLADCGGHVLGIDLSREMLVQAHRLNPALALIQANLLDLPLAAEAVAGLVAYYALIHVPRTDMPAALRESWRVLQPDGQLLLSFHRGTEVVHLTEWWEKAVSLDFIFFGTDELQNYLGAAGFAIEEVVERPPYPEVEAQTHRTYILARKLSTCSDGLAELQPSSTRARCAPQAACPETLG
jgi:ubiquinone/menaquinone biosynthesis C-methylase UbiE